MGGLPPASISPSLQPLFSIMGLGTFSMRINGAHCGLEAIVLGIVTNIGGFLFGYDTGQISGMLLFRDFNLRFGQLNPGEEGYPDLNPEIESILVSLMSMCSLRCIHCRLVGTTMEYDIRCWPLHRRQHYSDHGYAVLGTHDDGTIRRWSWCW